MGLYGSALGSCVKFILIGISHKTASVEVREKLDFSKKIPENYFQDLKKCETLSSAAVLSTCNRVEVYATTHDPEAAEAQIKNYLLESTQRESIEHLFYSKQNDEAISHLFRVTASLDSLIVGEPQIAGQVKEAYYISTEQQFSNALFDKIFQKAFSASKKVRNETKIGEQAVSISYSAVELAKKIFGDLGKTQVMIVGAGEMAELCAKHLKNYRPHQIYFVNRTYDQSAKLSQEYQGIPIEFDRFKMNLMDIDVLLVSTGASHYIVDRQDIELAMQPRRRKPIFIIDISVPRNVDPTIESIEDVYLYNIDDLQGQVTSNLVQRKIEADKAEILIAEEVKKCLELVEKLKLAPTLKALQDKYSELLNKEFEKLSKKMNALAEQDLAEIKKSWDVFMKKVLNDPIVYLTKEASSKNLDKIADFNHIFCLSKDDMKDSES